MNPASAKAAGREAMMLARKQLTGLARATARRRIPRIGAIAQLIWTRWNAGVYRWQLNHARWLMTAALRDKSPQTRYQYWLALRSILTFTGRERWLKSLKGDWCYPDFPTQSTSKGSKGV